LNFIAININLVNNNLGLIKLPSLLSTLYPSK